MQENIYTYKGKQCANISFAIAYETIVRFVNVLAGFPKTLNVNCLSIANHFLQKHTSHWQRYPQPLELHGVSNS